VVLLQRLHPSHGGADEPAQQDTLDDLAHRPLLPHAVAKSLTREGQSETRREPRQLAARRGRVCSGLSDRGTSVGLTFSSTTLRSMTHLPTSLRLGRSYMTLSRTSSRIARSPRAPVPRSRACSATASSASSLNCSRTPSTA